MTTKRSHVSSSGLDSEVLLQCRPTDHVGADGLSRHLGESCVEYLLTYKTETANDVGPSYKESNLDGV